MEQLLRRLSNAAAVRREEQMLAGRVGAAVWVIASLSLMLLALVLPDSQVHRPALIAVGAAGLTWGVLSALVVDFNRLSVWVIHGSAVVGTAAIAVAIALSGGSSSSAWACLFYVVVYAAYFFKPRTAAAYLIACVLVECVVVFASGPGHRMEAVGRLAVAAPAFLVLGVAIVAGKRSLWQLRRQAEQLAAEQGALRRVAEAVVSGEPAERFYQLVADEAGHLFGASGAGILRLAGAGEATILGAWAREPGGPYDVGARFPVPPGGDVATALSAGRPVRLGDEETDDSGFGGQGYRSSIVAPIKVGGRIWGFLTVVSTRGGGLTGDNARRLNEFADLIASSVTSIEDRATLAAQAATDALTGVGNHRTFHQRLNADLARARRYNTPVSVAIIDVDHFKQVNDLGGHEAGDERLVMVAGALSAAARAEDTVARIGGDEFAWILPETTGEEAIAAVERARRAIGGHNREELPPVTISAGVCDSRLAVDPTELVRLADRALYQSKENGRDQVRLYSPADRDELATH